MDYKDFDQYEQPEQYQMSAERVRQLENNFPAFLSRVFLIMFAGLAVTSVVGYLTLESDYLFSLMVNVFSSTAGMIISFIVYIALAVVMMKAVSSMNVGLATALFFLYSVLTGFMFSSIGFVYTGESIWKAFLAAGLFFGILAFVGVVIKRDLSKMGNILFVALISLIVVSVVNMFMRSPAIDFAATIIGLLIFAAYTIYDINKLKALYAQMYTNERAVGAIAIYGAFELYLDFINIFLRLLRLFGSRRD